MKLFLEGDEMGTLVGNVGSLVGLFTLGCALLVVLAIPLLMLGEIIEGAVALVGMLRDKVKGRVREEKLDPYALEPSPPLEGGCSDLFCDWF